MGGLLLLLVLINAHLRLWSLGGHFIIIAEHHVILELWWEHHLHLVIVTWLSMLICTEVRCFHLRGKPRIIINKVYILIACKLNRYLLRYLRTMIRADLLSRLLLLVGDDAFVLLGVSLVSAVFSWTLLQNSCLWVLIHSLHIVFLRSNSCAVYSLSKDGGALHWLIHQSFAAKGGAALTHIIILCPSLFLSLFRLYFVRLVINRISRVLSILIWRKHQIGLILLLLLESIDIILLLHLLLLLATNRLAKLIGVQNLCLFLTLGSHLIIDVWKHIVLITWSCLHSGHLLVMHFLIYYNLLFFIMFLK